MPAIVDFDPTRPLGPDNHPPLGRDTDLTIDEAPRLLEQVKPAPRLFRGPVPRKGVGLQRFRNKRYRGQLIGCCFPAGTLVRMADGGEKPIESVGVNDEVAAFRVEPPSGTGLFCPGPRTNPVVRTFSRRYTGNLITFILDDGAPITATADHQFYCEMNGEDPDEFWVPASDIQTGAQIFSVGGDILVGHTILRVTRRPVVDFPVYDFEVAEDHNFIAGGYLVHNCVGEAMAASGETTVQTPDPLKPDSNPTGLDVTFSALWTYHIARKVTARYAPSIFRGEGAIVTDALKAAEEFGLILYDAWPSTDQNYRNYSDRAALPGAEQARRHKPIGELRRLTSPDQVFEYLAAGYSVVPGTSWPANAFNTRLAADGRHWFDWTGRSVGGHAYELLDYDMDADWVCIGNSWDNARWGAQPGGFAYTRLSVYIRELSASMLANARSEAIVYTEVEGDWHPRANPADWAGLFMRI